MLISPYCEKKNNIAWRRRFTLFTRLFGKQNKKPLWLSNENSCARLHLGSVIRKFAYLLGQRLSEMTNAVTWVLSTIFFDGAFFLSTFFSLHLGAFLECFFMGLHRNIAHLYASREYWYLKCFFFWHKVQFYHKVCHWRNQTLFKSTIRRIPHFVTELNTILREIISADTFF